MLPSVVYVRTTVVGGGNGEGSGVVVDRAGIIVTNNHVVEGANEIEITFNDGRHRRPLVGTVIGTAAERDLAVVRVAARDLVPIRIARSSSLRLGDDVIAVGYPLGLGGPTVTSGIVSGLNRTVEPGDGPRLEGLLQTDAAINPGNSGGALVDRAGRLVGINTAAGRGDAAENIGFAIEIDAALPIIEEIRSEPEATRAWLGISICVRRVGRGGGRARARSLDARRPADGGLSGWAGRARGARARRRDHRARRRSDPVGADLDGGGCQARSRRPDRARGDRHGGAAARRADRDATSSVVKAPALATSRVRVLRVPGRIGRAARKRTSSPSRSRSRSGSRGGRWR